LPTSSREIGFDLQRVGQNLAAARKERGLSQQELAALSGLKQAQLSFFEGGRRWPAIPQLAKLAQILEVSLETLLVGDRLAIGVRDIAFELRNLGIVDLKIGAAPVPASFRPTEQVISLALAGDEPEPRIVEALPAVLAWNAWDLHLLRAYGRISDQRVPSRLAWLADITLTIERTRGFPGGVLQSRQLSELLRSAKPSRKPDSLGRSTGKANLPPIWKRWNITYADNLERFRERAQHLHSLRQKVFWKASRQGPVRTTSP
jgi:transcriptional regulator with XRE-family HTH domain